MVRFFLLGIAEQVAAPHSLASYENSLDFLILSAIFSDKTLYLMEIYNIVKNNE